MPERAKRRDWFDLGGKAWIIVDKTKADLTPDSPPKDDKGLLASAYTGGEQRLLVFTSLELATDYASPIGNNNLDAGRFTTSNDFYGFLTTVEAAGFKSVAFDPVWNRHPMIAYSIPELLQEAKTKGQF